MTYDIKSAPDDVAAAFEDFSRAFEAFRDTNDTRLSEIETRLGADVVTEKKLTRIDAALDDAKRRLDRIALGGPARRSPPPPRSPRTRCSPSTRERSARTCAPARPRA